jgi:hypothetical protein
MAGNRPGIVAGRRVGEVTEGTEDTGTEGTEDTATEGTEGTATEGTEGTGQDQHEGTKTRRSSCFSVFGRGPGPSDLRVLSGFVRVLAETLPWDAESPLR